MVEKVWKKFSDPLGNLKDVVGKLPSEESMNRFLEELPRIERIMTNGTLQDVAKLSALADAMQDGKIDKLLGFIPLLANVPDNKTLVDIVNMRPLLAQMPTGAELKALTERLPTTEKLDEMVKLLKEMVGFLEALKG